MNRSSKKSRRKGQGVGSKGLQLTVGLLLLGCWAPAGGADGVWETRSKGLTSLFIVGITIDPGNPDRIFVTTRGQGIWLSTDGAASWVKSSTGIPDWGPPYGHLLTRGVVIDNASPDLLYAAGCPSLNQGTYGRIYRSTNGGRSWFRSTSGASVGGWYGIAGITQDPADPNHLYAGSIVTGYGGGVFESMDRGATWTNIAGSEFPDDGDLGNDAWPIVIDPVNPQNVYTGSPHDSLLYSRDGGLTWTESNPAGFGTDRSTGAVTLNPLDPSELWIGHSDGTFFSDDSAVTWTDVSAGFGGASISHMVFAPSDPNIGYVLADYDLYRTTDNGDTWQRIVDHTPYGRCLVVHPTNPGVVLMGTWGRGVLRSANGGLDWEMVNTGMPVNALIDIDRVMAHPTETGSAYCHLRGNGLYHSENYGQDWSFVHPLDSFYMDSFLILPGDPERIFYTWYDMFRSTDGGETWETLLAATNGEHYRGLTYDPHRDWIWAVDSHYDDRGSQILYSDDYGDTWNTVTTPGEPPYDQYSAIAIDPFNPSVIIVAAAPKWYNMMSHGWVLRSDDMGASWTRVREGLELRGWNIERGYWYVLNDRFYQGGLQHCDLRAMPRDVHVHDATYTVRTRVTDVLDGDTNHWSGMAVCLPSIHSAWNDGILVGMRRNGECFLWSEDPAGAGTIRIAVPGAVPDASKFQTIGVHVAGNDYTLLVNGAELGTWTDPDSRWGEGHLCVATCRAQATYDNLIVTGPGIDFLEDFNIGNWGSGYNLTGVQFSNADPGVVHVMSSGEGVFRSDDHGLTWRRITTSEDENLYFYAMTASQHPGGNLYITKGSFYGTGFTTGVFPLGNDTFEPLGAPAMDYYRAPIAEDALIPHVLYTGHYGPGFDIFIGTVPRPTDLLPMWRVW